MRRPRAVARDPELDDERVARLQLVFALLIGAFVVGGVLFFWRAPAAAALEPPPAPSAAKLGVPEAAPAAKEPLVLVGEPRAQACHASSDPKAEGGPCGDIAALATTLKQAVRDNEACLPLGEGAGTLEYAVDLQFDKKRITVTAPQATRTIKSSKAAVGCANAVKRSLTQAGALSLPHHWARVKVVVQASYAARALP